MITRTMFKRILTEPLLHFIVLAVLFFVAYDFLNPQLASEEKVISVSEGRIDQLRSGFQKVWRRDPAPAELDNLIRSHVLDEIYTRKAMALGLVENDLVVRRRLRQKMEFMLQDMSALEEVDDLQLKAFYQKNVEQYRKDGRYSFSQVYLKRDRSESDLQRLIAHQQQVIDRGDEPEGDFSLLPGELSQNSLYQVERQFGEGFTQALDKAPLNAWSDPIESGLGIHFVRVTERTEGELPAFAQIRTKVLEDWRYERTKSFKAQYEQELLAEYQVDIEGTVASRAGEQ